MIDRTALREGGGADAVLRAAVDLAEHLLEVLRVAWGNDSLFRAHG